MRERVRFSLLFSSDYLAILCHHTRYSNFYHHFCTHSLVFRFASHFLPVIVLVGLYEEPERPPNAVDYIKRYMGAPTGVDVDAMRQELEKLKAENALQATTIKDLNENLERPQMP